MTPNKTSDTEPLYQRARSTNAVDDARGPLASRRTTVSLQAVSGLDAAQLASTRLRVTPHPTTFVAGDPADSAQFAMRVRRPG